MFPLKVTTWNVNGLRARHTQVAEFLTAEQPDVLCLQEVRATREQIPAEIAAVPGYTCYWHGGGKGYSGVSLHVAERLGVPQFSHPDFDVEARVVAAEVAGVRFYSVYMPNGGKDFAAKMTFFGALHDHMLALAAEGQPVVLSGDLNVARLVADVHPKERRAKPVIGQLPEERALFEGILNAGYVDIQRALDPDNERMFTWWAPWREMRQRNIGWRIDYVLASTALAARARTAVCAREFGTSDHAPLTVCFE